MAAAIVLETIVERRVGSSPTTDTIFYITSYKLQMNRKIETNKKLYKSCIRVV